MRMTNKVNKRGNRFIGNLMLALLLIVTLPIGVYLIIIAIPYVLAILAMIVYGVFWLVMTLWPVWVVLLLIALLMKR